MSANKAAACFLVSACLGTLLFFSIVATAHASGDIDTSADAKCDPFISQCSCGKVLVNGKCQFKGEKENMNGCSCESDVKPAGGICIAKNNCLGTWYTNQDEKKVPIEVPPDSANKKPGTTEPVAPIVPLQRQVPPPAGGGTPIADPSLFRYTPTPNVTGSGGADPWEGVGTEPTPISEIERLVKEAQANAPQVEPPTVPQKSFLEQTLGSWGISSPETGQMSPWTPLDANGNPIGESTGAGTPAQTTGFDPADPLSAESTSGCSGSWYCPLYEAGKRAWDAVAKEFGGGEEAAGSLKEVSTYGWGKGKGDSRTQELAGGSTLDKQPWTLANNTDPFGTKYRATNPDTGRSVIVEVRDRGPYSDVVNLTPHPTRWGDLSRAAAEELGMGYTVKNIMFERVEREVALGPVDNAPVLASVEPPSIITGTFEPPPPNYFTPLVTASPDDSIFAQWSNPDLPIRSINWDPYIASDAQYDPLTDPDVLAINWDPYVASDAQYDPVTDSDLAKIDWDSMVVSDAEFNAPPTSLTDEGVGATIADSQRPTLTDEGVGVTAAVEWDEFARGWEGASAISAEQNRALAEISNDLDRLEYLRQNVGDAAADAYKSVLEDRGRADRIEQAEIDNPTQQPPKQPTLGERLQAMWRSIVGDGEPAVVTPASEEEPRIPSESAPPALASEDEPQDLAENLQKYWGEFREGVQKEIDEIDRIVSEWQAGGQPIARTEEVPETGAEPEKPSVTEVSEAQIPLQESVAPLPSKCSGPSAADCVEALGRNWNTERSRIAQQLGCEAGTAICNTQILQAIRSTGGSALPPPLSRPVEDNPYAAAARYTGGSVVDFLNKADPSGKLGSFSSRAELARKYLGISNFSGTYKQNTDLLKALRATIK